MFFKSSNIDFLSKYNEFEKQSPQHGKAFTSSKMRIYALIPVIMIVIFAAYGILTYYDITKYKSMIYDMEQESIALDVPGRLSKVNELRDSISYETQSLKNIEASRVYYLSWSQADYDMFATVQACANEMSPSVEVASWSFSRNVYRLTIHCKSSSSTSPANFVSELKGTEYFKDIEYYGFTRGEEAYEFDVVCVLKVVNEDE